jgi:hypothetical protein
MEFRDKQKYQEIHPLKLATDISATALALYLFWHRAFVLALIVLIVPPVIVSTLIIAWVPLTKYRDSALGRYVDSYMTSSMRFLRLVGLVVTVIGAWFHLAVLISIGIVIVLLGWLRGVLLPKPAHPAAPPNASAQRTDTKIR